MSNQEEIPWWICKAEDKNFCTYVDTDSNYFHAEPLLRHLYPDFDKMDEGKRDDLLEKMALKYQDLITEYYDILARDAFNIQEHRLEMKTECTIRSGFFSGKRRYAQYITKKEGIEVEDIDVKGLDFMKSNFPPLFKKFFNEILNKILFGATRNEIDQEILEFKNSLDTLPLELLGKPTGVKDIKKYIERPPGAGNIFTTLKTGAPVNVKAAVRYNDFLKFKGLDKQHSQIVQGDKIKWVYLKDNPYKIDTMGFLDFDFPEEIRKFIEHYIDRDKAFDSILKNKLESFYKDLDWGNLTLNTHVNTFFSF
jgi:DNA polymerase elongation subunit (family B)